MDIAPVALAGPGATAPNGLPTPTVSRDNASLAESAPPAQAPERPESVVGLQMGRGVATATTTLSGQGLSSLVTLTTKAVEWTEYRVGRTDLPHGEQAALPNNVAGRMEGVETTDTPAAQARPADLLANFSPFDRATVEQAIDQLLDRFGDLEAVLPSWSAAERFAPQIMASALVIGAVELARRRLRATEGDATTARKPKSGSPFGLPAPLNALAWEEL